MMEARGLATPRRVSELVAGERTDIVTLLRWGRPGEAT